MNSSKTLELERELQGLYVLRDLPVEDGRTRTLRLTLQPSGAAALETCFTGIGSITERGTWNGGASSVHIHWTELEGERINLRMIFELRGRNLVFVGPDPHIFGVTGIVLERVEIQERI